MDICLQVHILSALDVACGYWAVCGKLFHDSTRILFCGDVFVVLPVLIYIVGWIFRTKFEFDVINNCFIERWYLEYSDDDRNGVFSVSWAMDIRYRKY